MISINSLNSLVSDWRAGVRMEAFCNVGIMAPPSKGGGTGWGGKKMVSDPCSEWTTSRRPMSNLWSWLCGLAQAREFWGWGILGSRIRKEALQRRHQPPNTPQTLIHWARGWAVSSSL